MAPEAGERPLFRMSPNHTCPSPFLLSDPYFYSGAAPGIKILDSFQAAKVKMPPATMADARPDQR